VKTRMKGKVTDNVGCGVMIRHIRARA